MSNAQPLSLREETELRAKREAGLPWWSPELAGRLLATLDESRRLAGSARPRTVMWEVRRSDAAGSVASETLALKDVARARVTLLRHQHPADDVCLTRIEYHSASDGVDNPATVQQPAPVVNDSPEVWPEVLGAKAVPR